MRKHKGYDDYKDSGVEWIGEIPEHWSVLAFKRLGDFQSGAGFPDEEQGLEDEELPFYKVSDTNLTGNERLMTKHNNTVSRETAKMLRAYVFPKDSIIFAKVGAALLLNKRRILTNPSCIDNNMMGFIPRTCNRDWMFYWMCGLDLGELANRGAVPSINERQIREIRVPVLPPKEQRSIAAFLDHKTSEIDALITDKEKLIELLKEQRRAIITEAVTKGLNPDVKMKDSGVEWIGEIPEHWEVTKIKYVAKIKYGLSQPPKEKEDGIPLIRATNIERGKINKNNLLHVDPTDVPCQRNPLLKQGDILVVRSGAYTADSALVTKEFEGSIAGYDMVLYYISMNSTMLSFMLLSKYVLEDQLYLNKLRAAQPHLNAEELGETIIVLPVTLEEQRCIADSVTEKAEKINQAISNINMQMKNLKEYRQSLIYEAVTGKIDVRDWSGKPHERSEAVANA